MAMNNQEALAHNLAVLAARAHAEGIGPGDHVLVTWRHDDGCPGLAANSFRLCCCKPEMDLRVLPNQEGA